MLNMRCVQMEKGKVWGNLSSTLSHLLFKRPLFALEMLAREDSAEP